MSLSRLATLPLPPANASVPMTTEQTAELDEAGACRQRLATRSLTPSEAGIWLSSAGALAHRPDGTCRTSPWALAYGRKRQCEIHTDGVVALADRLGGRPLRGPASPGRDSHRCQLPGAVASGS